jgi:para-aminobenzoate synthetase/4-amino-4-deoxychorismate lyase
MISKVKNLKSLLFSKGAKYTPESGDLFDVLLFNDSNQITETTISNIAMRRRTITNTHNPWITPNLNCGLLNGVHRQWLLQKGKIVEGVIDVDEVVCSISLIC